MITNITINTISELHRMLGLEKPHNPLITVINFEDVVPGEEIQGAGEMWVIINLYSISLKKNLSGKLKYGQGHYDFDEGVLGMMAPGQLIAGNGDKPELTEGWWLLFHADFIQPYPLTKTIKEYSYFSYAVNEALLLSAKEQEILEAIFENISNEYRSSIDSYSQNVMVSQLELLLNYVDRYYGRQFLTRQTNSKSLLLKFEDFVSEYFKSDVPEGKGLPSVQYFADLLNVSPHYLSDMLRKWTGRNAQQHIHESLIEKAKETLITTELSVSEIAYWFGFGHPQSFYKLFKAKTGMTPLSFRQKFN
jgi:AraC family transcriptional activator of pobA